MTLLDAARFLPSLIKANAGTPFAVTTVHAYQCSRKMPVVRPWETGEEIVAYVNHGRWLANCPHCQAGVAILFNQSKGWCFGCGAVFTNVTWPADGILHKIIDQIGRAHV